MITEQEYQEAQARVKEYEEQRLAARIERQQAAAKDKQRILLAAVEDPTVDGVDLEGDYFFRTPHRIITLDRYETWPDVNEWDKFVECVKELFPHHEDWEDYQTLAAAEKTQQPNN